MDLKDRKYIKDLIQLMGASDLTELAIEHEEVKLVLKRNRAQESAPAVQQQIVAAIPEQNALPTTAQQPAAVNADEAELDDGLHTITAPLVGTYYSAPAPDAPQYAAVGDKVKKGQILGIIEAMKLMNEIPSDADGTIVEIVYDNASPVEFGSKLFVLKLN